MVQTRICNFILLSLALIAICEFNGAQAVATGFEPELVQAEFKQDLRQTLEQVGIRSKSIKIIPVSVTNPLNMKVVVKGPLGKRFPNLWIKNVVDFVVMQHRPAQVWRTYTPGNPEYRGASARLRLDAQRVKEEQQIVQYCLDRDLGRGVALCLLKAPDFVIQEHSIKMNPSEEAQAIMNKMKGGVRVEVIVLVRFSDEGKPLEVRSKKIVAETLKKRHYLIESIKMFHLRQYG